MLCGDKATVGPFDNPFVALTGRCTVCVCVDNQTTGHNQNILSSQLQYTAQSNQISLTHNNNSGTIKLVENQHCCGGKSDKMWHGHSDWIVISQISFDGVHTAQQHQVIADDAGGKRKRYFRSNIRWIFFFFIGTVWPCYVTWSLGTVQPSQQYDPDSLTTTTAMTMKKTTTIVAGRRLNKKKTFDRILKELSK